MHCIYEIVPPISISLDGQLIKWNFGRSVFPYKYRPYTQQAFYTLLPNGKTLLPNRNYMTLWNAARKQLNSLSLSSFIQTYIYVCVCSICIFYLILNSWVKTIKCMSFFIFWQASLVFYSVYIYIIPILRSIYDWNTNWTLTGKFVNSK